MKAFDFNTFFGYENILNNKPSITLLISFLLPIALMIAFSLIAYILRKLFHLKLYLINVVLYTAFLMLFLGIFPIAILFFMGISGVKLAYCYSVIFMAIFFFCLVNGKIITKMMMEKK